MISPQQLRGERESLSVIMLEFKQKLAESTIHMFVEGDDGAYYRHFIARYSSGTIHKHNCGGKPQVLDIVKKVKSHLASVETRATALFFVDRDLDDYVPDPPIIDEEVYVTDYYAVENHLVCDEVLQNIIADYFVFHGALRPELSWLSGKYAAALNAFYESIEPLMLWAIHHKRIGTDFELKNVKIGALLVFDSDLDFIGAAPSISELDHQCEITTGSDFDSDKIKTLVVSQHPKLYVRGKFEAAFFLAFLVASANLVRKQLPKDGFSNLRYDEISNKNFVRDIGPRLTTIPRSLDQYLKNKLSRRKSRQSKSSSKN